MKEQYILDANNLRAHVHAGVAADADDVPGDVVHDAGAMSSLELIRGEGDTFDPHWEWSQQRVASESEEATYGDRLPQPAPQPQPQQARPQGWELGQWPRRSIPGGSHLQNKRLDEGGREG